MTLHEFLALPHRFRWGGVGGDDCTTFCASWIAEKTGEDPILTLRGSYRDQDGAAVVIKAAGGLVNLAASRIEAFGYVRTDNPQTGDVGIILAPSGLDGETKEIGAIRFGPLWATLSPSGVVAKRAYFVAAWHLPDDRRLSK